MIRKSKIVYPIIILILVISTVFGTVAFASEETVEFNPMPSAVEMRDAEFYAKCYGTTVQDALQRLHLMDISGQLHAELLINEVDTFGESWLEHTPEFKMVCQFTREGEEIIKLYLEKYPELAGLVEIRTTDITYAELMHSYNQVMADLQEANIIADTDLDVRRGVVKVYVTNRAALDDMVLPARTEVITVDNTGIDLYTDLIGGYEVEGPEGYGTSGFPAYNEYGRYVTTAGHVVFENWNEDVYYDDTYLLYQIGYHLASPIDIGYYATTEDVTNKIKDTPNTTRSIGSVNHTIISRLGTG